jgi:hypothetical protein
LRHGDGERILDVETPEDDSKPTHVVLNPPTDRRRAIEKFAFTQVFEEEANQLDVFHGTEIVPFVEGVLAPDGGEGTDAVVATLGVTGSGKVLRDKAKIKDSTNNCRHIPSSAANPSAA